MFPQISKELYPWKLLERRSFNFKPKVTMSEKHGTLHTENVGDVEVIQQMHADGTVDFVDTHAIGGDLEQMPKGYFLSFQFIGTVVVSFLIKYSDYTY